jgi:hypothetical protein
MTDVLSPVSSTSQNSASRDLSLGGQGVVFASRSKGAESAAALRAVDPSTTVRDMRRDLLRDMPVGPSPAFQINILQDIQANQRTAPSRDDATVEGENLEDDGDSTARETRQGASTEGADYQSMYRDVGAPNLSDQAVNIKV